MFGARKPPAVTLATQVKVAIDQAINLKALHREFPSTPRC